jgi:hypothetical protein
MSEESPPLLVKCELCGAFLEGGATEHAEECPFKPLIEEMIADVAAAARDAFGLTEHDLGYYILDGHTPVHVGGPARESTLAWGKWMEAIRRERIVKQESIGPHLVSTVFLGLDHSHFRLFGNRDRRPLLFETMAFTHYEGTASTLSVQERCSTWEEAEAQHAKIAGEFRKALNG